MDKLTNVTCDYTGGGVWVYSALFNNEVWLYGGLDWYFGSYSIPGQRLKRSTTATTTDTGRTRPFPSLLGTTSSILSARRIRTTETCTTWNAS